MNFGISFGVVWGLFSAGRVANWHEFWKGRVTLLLGIFVFAIGTLAIDTFFWPLPFRQYFLMWGIAVPLSTVLGAARLAYRLRYEAARRARRAKPVAVVKHPPAHDR